MKKKNKNNIKAFATSSVLSCMIAGSAFADDIEIYTGSKGKETNVNILFMLDTSGSMNTDIENTDETRMEQAKNALKEVINQLPGDMRVGLGRFNDPGGSILTPAKRLDDEVEVDTIKSSDEDAFENTDTKEVDISHTRLLFNSVGADISYKLDHEKDLLDARQCENGTNYNNTGAFLTLGYEPVYRCYAYEGFLLKNIKLHKGAKIKKVNIELKAHSRTINDTKTYFFYEDTANPKDFPPFYAAPTDPDMITNRNLIRTNYFWQINARVSPTQYPIEKYTKEDLKKVFQHQINKPDWEYGKSSFNFYMKSDKPATGNMEDNQFYSSSYAFPQYQPVIDIITEGNKVPNTVAIRFTKINAPSKSNVTKGLLKLVASEDNGSGTMTIQIEKGRTSASFTPSDGDISRREKLYYTLNLPFTNWKKDEYRVFDIESLLEKKFAGDWCGGGDVTLFLTSPDAQSVYAEEYGDAYNAVDMTPQLLLKYDGGQPDSCVSFDGVSDIKSAADDSNQREIDTSWFEDLFGVEKYKNTPFSNYIYLNNDDLAGFVFRDIVIPPNAKIKEAYIKVTAAEKSNSDFALKMFIDKPKDYPIESFSNKNNHLGLRLDSPTMMRVNQTWRINGVEKDVAYKSPDFATYLQRIIDSEDYVDADGEDRGIEINLEASNSNPLTLYSYDNSPSKSAKIVIRFEGSQENTRTVAFSASPRASSNSKLTVRQYLLELIDQQPTSGKTPMEGALYEAGQYFLGNKVDYGRSRHNDGTSAIPYKRISGNMTYTNGNIVYPENCSKNNLTSWNCADIFIDGSPKYQTPMTDNVCETNNIILITDGKPTSLEYTPSEYLKEQLNYDGIPLATLINNATGKKCDNTWECANDWVSHMYKTDFMPNKTGKSNILTHIIGFTHIDAVTELTNLAKLGGGVFNSADNTQELVNSLSLVISNIMDIESTLATPGVAVNQNNRLQNLSDIYYSVFKPTSEKAWNGNLKKYRVNSKDSIIVDKFGVNAVDPLTGFFAKKTTSFWSNIVDGGDVLLGGAAGKQTTSRRVFTYVNPSTDTNIKLSRSSNRVSENNLNLTRDLFDLSDDMSTFDYIRFLKWLRGVDVFDENFNGNFDDARKSMGDPLHSRPVLVHYEDGKDVVFVSTNDGFLHAINAETGKEEFAFIPKDLLKNSYNIYKGGNGKHIYGLDSSWVAWRNDVNRDGKIRKEDGDFVYLYSGMRRGGNKFYALDVTDIRNPVLKYIKSSETDPKFTNAGQTWSEPVLGRVKIKGKEKVVVIFGGGYDQSYDNENYTGLTDSFGNQLYMLDAKTGEVVWWMSGTNSQADLKLAGMNYSIVSKPTIVDLKGNGYVDTIYLTDLSSQIIKVNLNNSANTNSDFAKAKIIAKLGKSTGDTSIKNARMMFDGVAVAPVKNGNERFMAIVAGTGYRAHPLDKEKQDIILMLKDKEYFNNITEFDQPLVITDFADITNDLDATSVSEKLKTKKGFIIKLKEKDGYIGEKATGEPLIYDNQIILNTYVPNSKQGECSPVVGYARSYRINIFNGKPIIGEDDGETGQKPSDRYIDNITTGIANGSKLIYTEDGVYLLTNTKIEKIGSGGALGTHKKSWYKKQ